MNKAGKGFKGLTDVLAEVSEDDRRDRRDNALGLSDDEADRMKEIEDRERRQSIVARARQRFDRRLEKIENWNPEDSKVMNYIAERPWLSYPTMYGARGLAKGLHGITNGLHSVVGKAIGISGNSQDESLPENTAPKQTLSEKINNLGSMISNKIDGITEHNVNKINNFTDNVNVTGAAISAHAQDIEENGLISAWKHMFGKGKNEAAERREIEDDALGLTDDQEDRLKELEDKERYENASRKNIDFIQDQIELKDKEKAERKWRDKLLSTITGVGKVVSTAGTSLFDLLGKGFDLFKNGISNLLGGLGGLAGPLAALGGVLAWNNYKNSEEYITSRTDVDNDGDGQGDFIYDNTDANIARGYISARKPLIINPLKKIKDKFIDPAVKSGKDMYKGIKSGASNIYNSKIGQKTLQPIGNKLKKGKEYIFGTKPVKAATNTADNVIDFTQTKLAKEAKKNGANLTKQEKKERKAAYKEKLAEEKKLRKETDALDKVRKKIEKKESQEKTKQLLNDFKKLREEGNLSKKEALASMASQGYSEEEIAEVKKGLKQESRAKAAKAVSDFAKQLSGDIKDIAYSQTEVDTRL
jgi:hypothetical protein